MSAQKNVFFPRISPAVHWWLFGTALMVMIMAVIGAITRLTESGLSITEWQPITGTLPPLSDAAWLEEFEKYRATSQYQKLNFGMSLEEFKTIFWWEYIHRLWGRLIGVVYAVPLLIFWVRGMLPGWLKPHSLALLALGGLQGYIGWWMVQSGLVDRVEVSQYRLAVHLGLAVIIFAYTLWLFFRSKLEPTDWHARGFRLPLKIIIVGLFMTILAGALVAGMNAGLVYNTWPKMDGQWIPEGLGILSPWWLNVFENPTAVQFVHRWLAQFMVVYIFVIGVWMLLNRPPRKLKIAVIHLLVFALIQAALGIKTLLLGVHLWLGAVHQLGAFLLLAFALLTLYRLPRH